MKISTSSEVNRPSERCRTPAQHSLADYRAHISQRCREIRRSLESGMNFYTEAEAEDWDRLEAELFAAEHRLEVHP